MMPADAIPHAERLVGLMRGYYVSQALYVAARLGVADVLHRAAPAGLAVEELARATASQAEALYRMLRALAGEGIFEERPGRVFANSTASELLRADAAGGGSGGRGGSVRAEVLLAGETQFKVWTLLRETVQSGRPGFERVFRKPLFEFFQERPDALAVFNAAMVGHLDRILPQVMGAVRVSPGDRIVDVGGGLGGILVALLQKHPEARGILLESEPVIAAARETLSDSPLLPRIELLAGDFVKEVCPGEVQVLSWILHMFQDDLAARILCNCRAALSPTGRIYLVERIVKGPNEADPGKWDDLNMMVMTGGRERTLEEFRMLLENAGFTGVRQAGEGVVEARV